MFTMLRIGGPLLALALLPGPVLPQSRADELHAKFEREANPVQKAKIMEKLGDAEFSDITREASAGQLTQALSGLREYRDEARSCQQGLDAVVSDAEKHPGGFKQLQFSLRESLRRLDGILAGLTADEQQPFLDVRKDLDQINRHLIHELFPREPATDEAPPEKPRS